MVLLLVFVAVAVVYVMGRGAFGRFDSETLEPVEAARAAAAVAQGVDEQRAAGRAVGASTDGRQILFGDLHAHTTISFDAFMLNIPVMGGQGAAPPADACDFARHCAALDFWSINDHASNITSVDWDNTVEAIRQCNARAGDPANPDMVSFLGWEWTQAGPTPDTHFGHKNVVLAHTDDERIPTRPIAAQRGGTAANPPPVLARGLLALQGPRFRDLAARWTALSETEICPAGPVRELPRDCTEVAPTPAELFAKLDDWGHDAIVIPHGTAWGVYTPPLASWDKQLQGALHDPDRQTLLEIYSGHGDSEVYRDFRTVTQAPDGTLGCPVPCDGYLPLCWRAGEVIEARCLAEGESERECAARAADARHQAAQAGVSGHVVVPGITTAELLDAGQCRDCDQPSFNYRPAGSAQYIAALSNFAEAGPDGRPRRFRFGFIGSSDIHSARAGSGYKEVRKLSESPARDIPEAGSGIVASFMQGPPEEPVARARSFSEARAALGGMQLFETERVRSYLYTGGLIAVHAEGRDREAIWDAMDRKEVYSTSGPRLLLWFDLIGEEGSRPMGAEVATRDAPIFRVRAVGSRVQAPGCPASTLAALGPERTAALCANECYQPTDERRKITHIDVVRIRPQSEAGEDVGPLIDDPWQRFECDGNSDGCIATFVDPEFPALGRDTVYYARAFEEPTATINGQPQRCTEETDGRCSETELCSAQGDCLSDYAHRAWSSPIYVDYAR